MPKPLPFFLNYIAILLFFSIHFFPTTPLQASPSSVPIREINIKQIESAKEMQICLERLYTECLKARQNNGLTPDLEDLILAKSGESINKIGKLVNDTDLSIDNISQKFKDLFLTNNKILEIIMTANQEIITEIVEKKLDTLEDVDSFFNTPQWQTPHRLISLARYWMSWNGYYSSFLYPDNHAFRGDLLGKAIKGFSLTLIDIQERIMVIKALFGRALCFKELKDYDKSLRDFDSIIKKAKPEDPLYTLSRYEQALANYTMRNYNTARDQLETLDREADKKSITDLLGDKHRRLYVKVTFEPQVKQSLIGLKKEKDKKGNVARSLCRNALHALRKLSENDKSQANNIYQLAEEHAIILNDLPADELGPVGNLGVADALFNNKMYGEAAKRYAYLWNSSHPLFEKRMDDIYFRSGYSRCQTKEWREALICFDNLFHKFPDSGLIGKAACLQYLAATGNYRENPGERNYSRWMESSKTYLKGCPDPVNKNEAHFQLGKYYYNKKKGKHAQNEFSLVDQDSPRYWPAQYYMVKSNMERLEALHDRGKGRTSTAKTYFKDTLLLLEKFQKLPENQKTGQDIKKVAAHMTIMHASLLCNLGPEETRKDTLTILKDFECRFPQNRQFRLKVKNLRMKCYMKYQMVNHAQKEINGFFLKGTIRNDLWAFLNKWAGAYYKEAKRLRDRGEDKHAGLHAETAIIIYCRLSEIASRQTPYAKYLNSIQLRSAELYMDENQSAKAVGIYLEYLNRNPDSADALYNLGIIYEKEDDWQSALEAWRKFSSGMEEGSVQWIESRYRIALAHYRLKKPDRACEILTMTRILHPEVEDEQLVEDMKKLEKVVCKR